MKRSVRITLLLAGFLTAWPCAVSAQQYPTSPIHILVGFGPGSGADVLARVIAKQMEQSLGQPVVVENRPGNSSMIAAETVARANRDGYTLFMATIAQTINPAFTHSSFNLNRDMAPIALLGVVPDVLVAHPSVLAKNVPGLVALAKANPESLTFGTSGAGTASHLAAELFNLKAGTKILPVHYQGGSNQALTDLLAGRITLMFNIAATLAPHIENGGLKALGMAQPQRAGILPDVPTMAEQGIPGFDAGIWIGLLAPVGTSPVILDKVSVVANAALKTETVSNALKTQGIDPIGSTPQEFADYIRTDIDRWTGVIKAAGLTQ
jgi:tripartite-type tricarboxylate transporter receptor subunit TctC